MTQSQKEYAALLSQLDATGKMYKRTGAAFLACFVAGLLLLFIGLYSNARRIDRVTEATNKIVVQMQADSDRKLDRLAKYLRCVALIPQTERTDAKLNACAEGAELTPTTAAEPAGTTQRSNPTSNTSNAPAQSTRSQNPSGGNSNGGQNDPDRNVVERVVDFFQPAVDRIFGTGAN